MSTSIYCNVGRHAPECGGEECSCLCHTEEHRGFTDHRNDPNCYLISDLGKKTVSIQTPSFGISSNGKEVLLICGGTKALISQELLEDFTEKAKELKQ